MESSESEGEGEEGVAMAVGEPGELPPSDSSQEDLSSEDDEVWF